jgi:hypothetical protein
MNTPKKNKPAKKEENPLIDRLMTKSATKRKVFENTAEVFQRLKVMAAIYAEKYNPEAQKINPDITVEYSDKGEYDAHLKVAGDLLMFTMHSNVFEFPRDHVIMKSSYVREDPLRSYCGIIYIYNFLADSFRYNRLNDIGYLVARILVNKEFHFIVEGKRQMEFLNNTFNGKELDEEALQKIMETAVIYCLDFDLLCTPYDTIKEVTVAEMMEYSQNMNVKTGKRLGFRFQADPDEKLFHRGDPTTH